MSDLISRSALIERLKKYKSEWKLAEPFHEGIASGLKIAIEVTEKELVAYDVDKVVKELEDYQMWKGFMIYDLTHREREIIRKAIEIVKGGVK